MSPFRRFQTAMQKSCLNIKESIEALPVAGKVVFSDFTPNPLYEQVCKGVELFKASPCDAILAVGGGSAIDVARCIKLAVLAAEGDKALIPPLVSQLLAIEGSRIPFMAIPTTAGTSRESTHNAVMYFEGTLSHQLYLRRNRQCV